MDKIILKNLILRVIGQFQLDPKGVHGVGHWARVMANGRRLKAAVPAHQAMIELPGPWIADVTLNNIYEMTKQTLKIFGPDANLGNVAWDQIINLECLRQGIGIAGPHYL